MSDIKVVKFGGTSVATIEKIDEIAQIISNYNEKVVVVISAMGKNTDHLLSMVKELNPYGAKRDIDMLVATGEQQSAALMSIALQKHKQKSIALSGLQAGIKCVGPYQKGNISDIDPEIIFDYFKEYDYVVVTGFQGFNEKLEVQTLGRGGSDTSAVALAAKLKAPCYIYTDVKGVYTIDPRVYQKASKLDSISYQEMIELSLSGSAVLEPRCVEIAAKYNVDLYVGQITAQTNGTWIRKEEINMESKEVVGLSVNNKVVRYQISDVEDVKRFLDSLYEYVMNENIVLDNLKQENNNVTFLVNEDEILNLDIFFNNLLNEFTFSYIVNQDIACLTLVGNGFRTSSSLVMKTLSMLNNHLVPFEDAQTTNLSFSFVLPKHNVSNTTDLLATSFNL